MFDDYELSGEFRCVTIDHLRNLSLQSRPVPPCQEKEMILAVLYAGICDTDRKILEGKREYKPGIVLGHEAIAKILEVGKNVEEFQRGDLVTFNPNHPTQSDHILGHDVDGVFATHFIATQEMIQNRQIVRIPPEIQSPLEAIFIEPVACAVHSLIPFKNDLSEKVVTILGGEQFDKLHALVAKAYGAKKVILIHSSRQNLDFAREAGIISSEDAVSFEDALQSDRSTVKGSDHSTPKARKMPERSSDIVILATSFSMDSLPESLALVKNGGLVILFGSTRKTDVISFPGGELDCHAIRLYNKRVRLEVAPGKIVEFMGSRKPTLFDMQEAINLLSSGKIQASRLASRIISLDYLPDLVESLRNSTPILGKILVDMRLSGKTILPADIWKSRMTEGVDPRKVAVIGATGDLGSQLAIALIDRGYRVMVSARAESMKKLRARIGTGRIGKVDILEGTVFSVGNLKRMIAENSAIYDMSGLVGLDIPQTDYAEALAVNGFAKGLIAAFIKRSAGNGKVRFIYPSSQRVSLALAREDIREWALKAEREFDGILENMLQSDEDLAGQDVGEQIVKFAQRHIAENPIPEGVKIYELTKVIGEHYVSTLKNAINARISHIYGEGYGLKYSIMRIVSTLITGGSREEKNILLTPVYVQDLNEILIKLATLHEMHLDRYKLMDISGGAEIAKDEIIKLVAEIVPIKGEIVLQGSIPEKSHTSVDLKRAKELLGRPFTSFDRKVVTRLIDYILAQKNSDILTQKNSDALSDIVSCPKKEFPNIVVFDVGGTTTRVGAFFADGRLADNIHKFETPGFKILTGKSIEEIQQALLDRIQEYTAILQREHPQIHFSEIAISFAGTVKAGGVIGKAASLWGSFENFPLQKKLEEKMPVWNFYITNDVVAAAWRYGILEKYKSYKKICIVTISSGVGYKIFDTINPDIQDHYVASLGHIKIDESPNARPCECGKSGHLAAYASGRAAEQRIKIKAIEDLSGFRNSCLWEMARMKIQKLSHERRKKLLADKLTIEIMAQVEPAIRERVVHILSQEKIDYLEIKSAYPTQEVDTALAIVLENEEFCTAIQNDDPFALELFREITLILAREFVKVASAGVDKFILMGGFAHATRKNFERYLIGHIKNIGLYEKNDEDIENLIDWSENDDQHGLVGVANMVRYAYGHEQETGSKRIEEILDFSQATERKERIVENLRKNKAGHGEILTAEDADLLHRAFVVSYVAHNILSENKEKQLLSHSLAVARYLVEKLDSTDVSLLAAAFLHDTIEYSHLTSEQIARCFHPEIANIVSDLSQNSEIKHSNALQLSQKGFDLKKIAGLLGIDNAENEIFTARVSNMATKIEHYERLTKNPLNAKSRLLKVVDNIVSYSAIDHYPSEKLKKREPAELEMFRSFSDAVDMPDIARRDIYYYLDRWLEVPYSHEVVDAQYKAFAELRKNTDAYGIDCKQLRERKKYFQIENGIWKPDVILFKPTAIIFGYPLAKNSVEIMEKMQDCISRFFGETIPSPREGCIFYRNDMQKISHITLITYTHYTESEDRHGLFMSPDEIGKAAKILEKYLPIAVFYRGMQIMADGVILVKAFVANDTIVKMNKELVEALPGIRKTISAIRYVNLGRLLDENIPPAKIAQFNLEFGDLELGKERFTHATACDGQKLPLGEIVKVDSYASFKPKAW